MDARGARTARGGEWSATQAQRVPARSALQRVTASGPELDAGVEEASCQIRPGYNEESDQADRNRQSRSAQIADVA